MTTLLAGTVVEFDDDAGLGRIRGADGAEYPFQCIEIGDGSRQIDAGQVVVFARLPRFGQFQAGRIQKV